MPIISPARICSIVLNWNKSSLTRECISHLQKQSYGPQDLLIVDNGSEPAERDTLRRNLPRDCRLSELKENLGFAGGMNAGLKFALAQGYEYAWLVNNDAFPEQNCLASLIECFKVSAKLAAVSPALHGTNGRQQHVGGRIQWELGDLKELVAAEMVGTLAHGFWLTGTAPAVRLAALKDIGLFDERFFAYWEDVDLCARITGAGYELQVAPEASCLHLGGTTSGGIESPFPYYLAARNAILFFSKHLVGRQRIMTLTRLLAGRVQLAQELDKSQKGLASAIYQGLLDGLKGRHGKPLQVELPDWLFRLIQLNGRWLVPTLARAHQLLAIVPAARRTGPALDLSKN